jgi:hypothetical protein
MPSILLGIQFRVPSALPDGEGEGSAHAGDADHDPGHVVADHTALEAPDGPHQAGAGLEATAQQRQPLLVEGEEGEDERPGGRAEATGQARRGDPGGLTGEEGRGMGYVRA